VTGGVSCARSTGCMSCTSGGVIVMGVENLLDLVDHVRHVEGFMF
jgi:hypothetical protein